MLRGDVKVLYITAIMRTSKFMAKMKDKLKKVKKKRIKWREVIFHLHRRDISEAFSLFRVGHPDLSINRCAYNVIKTFYSTTIIRAWKDLFENYNQDYDQVISFHLVKLKWF